MGQTLELSSTDRISHPRRRLGLGVAAVAVLLGAVALTAALFVADKPKPGIDPVRASTMACELRVLRQLPLPAPADATFSEVAAARATGGYRVSGVVEARNPNGAAVRLRWECATELRGGEWYAWSVTETG